MVSLRIFVRVSTVRTAEKLDALDVQPAIGRSNLAHSFWTECVSHVTFNHCIHSNRPIFVGGNFAIELQFVWNNPSVMYTNNSEFIQLDHGILDKPGFALFVWFWVDFKHYVHCVITEDTLGRSLTARDVR